MARDYTDAELSGLTEEERTALLDDSDDSGDMPAPSNIDGDAHTEEDALELDEDADDEGDETADAAATEEAGKKSGDGADADADTGAATTDGADDVDAVIEQGPAPILEAEIPADADARIQEIATQKDQIAEQFDNGDLTGREYQAALDKLNKQEREIEQEVFKANLAAEMSETQARNSWIETTRSFLDEHAEYRSSPLRYSALNEVVKSIAKEESSAGLTGRQILEKAHDRVAQELGGTPAKKEEPAAAKPAKQNQEVPTTLAKLPAAETEDTSGNRFASLDRLAETDPLRYEQQMAKMSPADREAYLSQ